MADPAEGLEGRVALVTGAASGIGRASALALAAAGADIVGLDVDAGGLDSTLADVRAAGRDGLAVVADVTSPDDVGRAFDQVMERFGRLDIAHNNAGWQGPFRTVDDYDENDFARVIAVDLGGVWRCMKHEIPLMKVQGSGSIINTSSMLGSVGMATNGPYTAAKHGVHGLTKAAALELARHGVRVNAIAPGVTQTGMTSAVSDDLLRAVPMGRIASAAEIAAVVVWLASDASSYVTGAVVVADGGYTVG